MNGLADNLRQMRASRSISQLELALRLDVSQRHVSFVELGRARPSRNLILSWARETGATPDERNAALVTAGFSPVVEEFGNEGARDSTAFRVLSDMLTAHEPCPGIVFDADWMIRAMNESGQWLCRLMMPEFLASMDSRPAEMDMIAAVAHPRGLLNQAQNAPEVGFALLNQLRAEQLTRPALRSRVDRLETALQEFFGEPPHGQGRAPGEPHLHLIVNTKLGPLSFLLVQTVFGLPQNVTHASLRTELWFPIDDPTRQVMASRGRQACDQSMSSG